MASRRKRSSVIGLVLAIVVLGASAAIAVYIAKRAPRGIAGPPVCAPGPTVKGIDVSYYQEAIKWPRVRKAGVVFAFIRASDGVGPIDPRFAANWSGAKAAGVLRGAYLYFRPGVSATAQADVLVATLEKDRGELPPVVDVEVTEGLRLGDVKTFVDRVRARLDVEPIVYTAPGLWPAGDSPLGHQPLWVAHYLKGDGCPAVPALWSMWTFWQYSESGAVPGITGKVDLDVFAGTYSDLETFMRSGRQH